MKIFFSKDQFAKLVRLVYLGHRVVNGIKTDDYREDYEKLYRYVLGFCQQFGLSELISEDKETGTIYPSRYLELEDEVDDLRQEYEQYIFREELTDHLAMRDILLTMSIDDYVDMKPDERLRLKITREEIWSKEFEEHGIERIYVKK